MNRRTLTVLAVAAVAILAISLSAATLTSTVGSDGDGGGSERLGGDGDFGFNLSDDDDENDSSPSGWSSRTLQAVLAVFVILAVVSALVSPRQTAMVIAGLVGLVGVVWLLTTLDLAIGLEGDLFPWEGERDGDLGSGTPEQDDVTTPLVLALGALVSVVVLGVVLLLRRAERTAPDERDEDEEPEPEEGDETTVIGAIAGQAADRIEMGAGGDSGATNEVYRAWREMTDQLAPEDRETTTPREFQRRAVDAGMAPDDVRELTRLFERVRYGGEQATEDREARAVSVLRRIESTYGEQP